MEDAHIASINLGNAPDAAIFGVFDGHGGRLALKRPSSTNGCLLQDWTEDMNGGYICNGLVLEHRL